MVYGLLRALSSLLGFYFKLDSCGRYTFYLMLSTDLVPPTLDLFVYVSSRVYIALFMPTYEFTGSPLASVVCI